ncbi:hypothetical protein QZH41_017953 [Actinostola sp. cb2023]|nr:hypothetical protein QZH41_017953 [Actinostola sp. cb2023]
MAKVNCSKAETRIHVYKFSKEHTDRVVHFQVLRLEGSLFFWIGNANVRMSSLCVAMNTKYDHDGAAVTALLGDPINISCGSLAQRLAKKTNTQCYVSYNGTMDEASLGFVENTITQEMKDNPQHF